MSIAPTVRIADNDIRRSVAMKVILGDQAPSRVERFVEEAQVTGQLEHPNIVPVHEIGLTPEGNLYFTQRRESFPRAAAAPGSGCRRSWSPSAREPRRATWS